MPIDQSSQKRIRLWPGVVAVVFQWFGLLVLPRVMPDGGIVGFLAALVAALIVLLWWLFFSRAPWVERVVAIVLMIPAVFATSRFVHESISNGMMGMMLYIYSIPVLSLALVSWAVLSRGFSSGPRRASMIAAILVACGAMTLLRTGGISGEGVSDFHLRWTKTPEDRLLAQAADEPAPLPPAPTVPETPNAKATPVPLPPATETAEKRAAAETRNEPTALSTTNDERETVSSWPGFRGPKRDGVVPGVRIETDWSRQPPVALWRRPIGPGWSSFAVRGNLIYTQEQRGTDELVSSYNLTTGEPVWRHKNAARFWESNGGAGPRGTPTLSGGRVYTFGATGILNALDARNGSVIWSHNVASDTKKKIPEWGFSSSPLVVGDIVIVAAASALAAYDVVNGNPRWFGPKEGGGYSSPQLATIGGVTQVLLLTGDGAIGVDPADGKLLWKHAWPGDSIVQPAVTTDGDVLIGSGSGLSEVGLRRISIMHGPGGWTAEERWTSNALKPYFNDFVIHQDHAFGFDGSLLACMDLKDGKRKWKGGRYGHGQLVLLPDQDLLLVLSEEGELVLVKATPDQFTELARFKAIEGKTWNHPVLTNDILLVRNGEEMVAFKLSLASR
jgi:outer membrane protein assembly factor BamB